LSLAKPRLPEQRGIFPLSSFVAAAILRPRGTDVCQVCADTGVEIVWLQLLEQRGGSYSVAAADSGSAALICGVADTDDWC